MTQEHYSDLKKYIPESDMVKMAYGDSTFLDDDWEKIVQEMVTGALEGDRDKLFELLELTYVNAHNEGFLDGTDRT